MWHKGFNHWLIRYMYIPLGGNRGSSVGTWLISGIFFLIALGAGLWQGIYEQNWWVFGLWTAAVLFFVTPAIWQGSRQQLATSMNLLNTMLLGGLWHGASNQFLIWGLMHGTALSAERWWKGLFPVRGRFFAIRKALGWVWAFHFVSLCWIFFRAGTMDTAWTMLDQIFNNFNGQLWQQVIEGYAPVILLMGIGFLLHAIPEQTEQRAMTWVTRLPLLGKVFLLCLIIMLVMQVKSAEVQPFKYFDF